MTNKAILVFQKNLIAGRTKTRLAATIGNEKALFVYKQLISITTNVLINLPFDKLIYYSEFIPLDIEDKEIETTAKTLVLVQHGNDLGARMLNSFSDQFKMGYSRLIIIGTDCPDLNSELLLNAFNALESHDIVIGPAADGGYYLLGMSKLYPELFEGVEWSTSEVYGQTVDIISKLGLSFSLMPVLRDLDNEDDLKYFNHLKLLS